MNKNTKKRTPIFAICLTILFSTYAMGTEHFAFPDYSNLSDTEINKKIKGGFVDAAMGLTLETASAYVPRISPKYMSGNTEFLTPQTVKGLGNVILISGVKELFFASKEKYARYRNKLGELPKGGLDLGLASAVYVSAYHMPYLLNEPFVLLGGQGGCIILYSFLALRGIQHATLGLKDCVINMDCTQMIQHVSQGIRGRVWSAYEYCLKPKAQ